MKKFFILFIFVVCFVSCGPNTYRSTITYCKESEKDKMAQLINEGIKNANNMSDEEMEDVIPGIRRTIIGIYCRTEGNATYELEKCLIPNPKEGEFVYDVWCHEIPRF